MIKDLLTMDLIVSSTVSLVFFISLGFFRNHLFILCISLCVHAHTCHSTQGDQKTAEGSQFSPFVGYPEF